MRHPDMCKAAVARVALSLCVFFDVRVFNGCLSGMSSAVPPGLSCEYWLKNWEQMVLPRLEKKFDLLFISAGFDAHRDDPKGEQSLATEDYFRMTSAPLSIAKRLPQAGLA